VGNRRKNLRIRNGMIKPRYDSVLDSIIVSIDECEETIQSSPNPYINLDFNFKTGGVCGFQILKITSLIEGHACDFIEYTESCDNLSVHLLGEDDTDGMCDMVFLDNVLNILIVFNRDGVGNLTGLEITGVTDIMENFTITNAN